MNDSTEATNTEVTSLHRSLREAFVAHASAVAIRHEDDSWTFSDLDRLSDAFAVTLSEAGVTPGDRVMLMGKARPEFIVTVLAILRLGAAVVLVSPAYKSREIRHAIELTRPVLVAADVDVLESLVDEFDGPAIDIESATAPELLGASSKSSPQWSEEAWLDAEAALVFSSGTTGLPKAVVHSHRTLGAATVHWATALGLSSSDRFQVATPPSHILGLLNIVAAASRGASLRLHPRFDVDEMLRSIQDDRLTLEMAVAPIAIAMAEHPAIERYDLSSLRYIMWCATPVVPAVADRVTARTGVRFITAYGASELPLISANAANAPDTWRIDTAGRHLDEVTVRVVHPETGEVLSPGSVGEIQAHSVSVMIGYLPAEANLDAFDGDWYRTGDIGWVEEGGWLHITDRLKEMIKVKGFQVAPAEVEAVLIDHPAVADCAVFGVPDPDTGEAVVAAVVRAPDAIVSADELQDLVAASLAKYKRPRVVEFVDAVPRTPSGKVLRRELKHLFGY